MGHPGRWGRKGRQGACLCYPFDVGDPLGNLPAELKKYEAVLRRFLSPCVGFTLTPAAPAALGTSRLGGGPDLPEGFSWPIHKKRPLDFLLQVDLRDLSPFQGMELLPKDGLLSFFYDLEEQPWGFDPAERDGFKVLYTPAAAPLSRHPPAHAETAFRPAQLKFRQSYSFPSYGSRDEERLEAEAGFSEQEGEAYLDFSSTLPTAGAPPDAPIHQFLGHSSNIQGDMQLEAQLVTHGLYCGNASGYEDPRRKELEAGAEDWLLLLQLDTDDSLGFMWGDCGRIYYWIRRQDLKDRRFDRAWLGLQCS